MHTATTRQENQKKFRRVRIRRPNTFKSFSHILFPKAFSHVTGRNFDIISGLVHEYLSTMLFKTNSFWVTGTPWSRSMQNFFRYYTWTVFTWPFNIQTCKWSSFFAFLKLIKRVQHKLHLPSQLHKHFNINYTSLNKLTFFQEEVQRFKWNRFRADKLSRMLSILIYYKSI